ncbi:amidohydrolase family protein [Pseudooceanicola sp. C21-150M6]|uniref:amidohydrolase family protein n=1 Tax=Pseudooceanicola sp. C21-150M6 TaxID=3434355 RepID=UPI003D7FFAB0
MALGSDTRAQLAALSGYLHEEGAALAIDGDVHPTPKDLLPPNIRERMDGDHGYYHGRPLLAEDLIATLDLARVDMALCWQNPAVLSYGTDQVENAERLTAANRAIADLARSHPQRVIPAGWTDPKALGLDEAKRLARRCVEEFGMPVVKMNPAQNEYPIDDPMVFEVVDLIVSLGAVPAFHFGSDGPFTPPEGLARVAARHPDHPVIGVHMGGGGGHFVEAEETYQKARRLGLEQTNIFYVLSAIRDPHIESALIGYSAAGGAAARNIGAGSDAPYGNMMWNFGGFRTLLTALRSGQYPDPRLGPDGAPFDDAQVNAIMGGNLAALVAAACDRVLERG